MWAYYLENMLYKDRYGVNPGRGYSYWFRPEIFVTLEEGGLTRGEIFSALKSDVTDLEALQKELTALYPAKKSLITQAFKKYRR